MLKPVRAVVVVCENVQAPQHAGIWRALVQGLRVELLCLVTVSLLHVYEKHAGAEQNIRRHQ
jgi:hypothetical protein